MNKVLNKYVLFFLLCTVCYSQPKQSVDSLIRASTIEIYENPEKVIESGIKIVSDSLYDIDTRIKALLMISSAYSSKREYQSSLNYALKAKTLLSKTNNPLMRINVLDRIAVQYHQLGIFDKAIETLNESEKLCINYPVKDSIYASLGINYAIRGFIYREQLNCEIALGYFNRSISEFQKVKSSSVQVNQSIVIYNKANCYVLLADYKKAKDKFIESISLAEQMEARSLKAFALKGYAEVLTLEGQYSEAIKTLEEAQQISIQVGDLILNREIFRGLSHNFLAINELEQYQLYNKKFLELDLQIKESERASVSSSIEDSNFNFKNGFEQKKAEYIYMISGVVLLIVLTLIVCYFNKTNTQKRVNRFLEKIKEAQNHIQ